MKLNLSCVSASAPQRRRDAGPDIQYLPVPCSVKIGDITGSKQLATPVYIAQKKHTLLTLTRVGVKTIRLNFLFDRGRREGDAIKLYITRE